MNFQITEYCHHILEEYIEEGDICIDATAGNGGDTGYEEKEAILNYLKTLDSKKWLVIVNSYFNRKNDPPLPVFIYRLK